MVTSMSISPTACPARQPILKAAASMMHPSWLICMRRCALFAPIVRAFVTVTPRSRYTGTVLPCPIGCMHSSESRNSSVSSGSRISRS